MSASPEITARGSRASVRIAAAALLLSATIAGIAVAVHRVAAGDSVDAVQTSLSTPEPRFDLALGRALFERSWVSAPASTKSTDGLGPFYNARSCAACHTAVRRQPADESGRAVSSAIVVKFTGSDAPDPVYGEQLQTTGVHGLPAEGQVQISYEEIPIALADGRVVRLQKPSYRIDDLGYGPLDPATVLSPRVPPSLAGIGLLERIDAASILAWAEAEKARGDGISGQPSRPADCADQPRCIGRFGWKAAAAAIDDQNALAFSLDIGMSTPRRPAPWGDCTPTEDVCQRAPHGADAAAGETEIAPQLLALVDAFVRAEPAPTRHGADSPLAAMGTTIFADVGCAACHRPSYKIAAADGETLVISPYSDLLLHDLGDGLRDAAGPAGEWRTAPLWGLGTIDRAAGPKAYLHDGRARSLEEAILWHGGEATQVVEALKALTTDEWNALLAFLRSL
jgi:CxxC motif-containing protein (DUF1111 family)